MTDRRGLVIVYTGDGKGKTTAALGLALRAAGATLRVSVLQWMKNIESGEHRALAALGDCVEILRLGTGFVTNLPPPQEAVAAARRALDLAAERLTGGRCDMLILDEIFPALSAELITQQDIFDLLDRRPHSVHLVLTGRDAPPEIIERADIATEMMSVHHAFDRGIPEQPGIEF